MNTSTFHADISAQNFGSVGIGPLNAYSKNRGMVGRLPDFIKKQETGTIF
jgi:hypothetical protein